MLKCKIRTLQLLFLTTVVPPQSSQCGRNYFFTQHTINLENPWSQGDEEATQMEKAAERQKKIPNSECTVFGLRNVVGNP